MTYVTLTVETRKTDHSSWATYQWDILIRMDQLTGCTGGGEGGGLTGHSGGRLGDSAAASVGTGHRGSGLGVGWECGLGGVRGGGGGWVGGPRHRQLALWGGKEGRIIIFLIERECIKTFIFDQGSKSIALIIILLGCSHDCDSNVVSKSIQCG